PMNSSVNKTLKDLCPASNKAKANDDALNDYVFKFRGKPLKDIRTAFEEALRRAGIKDFVFHDLRHTFASHLVQNGVDLASVKELLRHKTIGMTMRYINLNPKHKMEAVETLYKEKDARNLQDGGGQQKQ
ncbi:MAG: site-specific integrase, partial [Candidatus Firestonebacteria bacterium]|nr:site-specific integrase [Candidatus Firestonebacteria bacterium]